LIPPLNLRRLHIAYTKIDPQTLPSMLEHLSLRNIGLPNDNFNLIFKYAPNLRTLRIQKWFELETINLDYTKCLNLLKVTENPNLREIIIRSNTVNELNCGGNKSLVKLELSCPTLRILGLKGVNDKLQIQCDTFMPNLSYLRIRIKNAKKESSAQANIIAKIQQNTPNLTNIVCTYDVEKVLLAVI